MTEIFKTDVENPGSAMQLISLLQRALPGSRINFDLQDCDRILRVQTQGPLDTAAVIALLRECGHCAEVLSDEVPCAPVTELGLA